MLSIFVYLLPCRVEIGSEKSGSGWIWRLSSTMWGWNNIPARQEISCFKVYLLPCGVEMVFFGIIFLKHVSLSPTMWGWNSGRSRSKGKFYSKSPTRKLICFSGEPGILRFKKQHKLHQTSFVKYLNNLLIYKNFLKIFTYKKFYMNQVEFKYYPTTRSEKFSCFIWTKWNLKLWFP